MHGTCDKCKSKENYNFVINNGLCDPCIEARLDELETHNDLWKLIVKEQKERIAELEAEYKKHQIKSTKAMMVAAVGIYLGDNSDYYNHLWEILEELATPDQYEECGKSERDFYDKLKATLPEKE